MTVLLEGRGISKYFGALAAVEDVSFDVREGEILGLIGPNGAGKTTLVGLIAGTEPPTRGELRLDGRSIGRLQPYQRAALGIARTFQIPRPLTGLTVAENVLVPALYARRGGRGMAAAEAHAHAMLETVGLADTAAAGAEQLTVTERKRLELARALALEPRLLLLDEVMAGLNRREIEGVMDLVRQLNARGITVIMIEHLMKAVMSLSHRVLVLHHGRRIAEGTPAEVTADPAVVQAYLGRRYAEAGGGTA
jgi:branched-chain amino acid transport system ATP-binding protein